MTLRYLRRLLLVGLFARCPDCGNRVNRLPSGRSHCPWCGKRKP